MILVITRRMTKGKLEILQHALDISIRPPGKNLFGDIDALEVTAKEELGLSDALELEVALAEGTIECLGVLAGVD